MPILAWPKFDPSKWGDRDLRVAIADALVIAQSAVNFVHAILQHPETAKELPDTILDAMDHLIMALNECEPNSPILRMARDYRAQIDAWEYPDQGRRLS